MSKIAVPAKKHIRSSFRDAIYTNLNIGMAESYFAAFMLALGKASLLFLNTDILCIKFSLFFNTTTIILISLINSKKKIFFGCRDLISKIDKI